jgi:hypothetical protein
VASKALFASWRLGGDGGSGDREVGKAVLANSLARSCNHKSGVLIASRGQLRTLADQRTLVLIVRDMRRIAIAQR